MNRDALREIENTISHEGYSDEQRLDAIKKVCEMHLPIRKVYLGIALRWLRKQYLNNIKSSREDTALKVRYAFDYAMSASGAINHDNYTEDVHKEWEEFVKKNPDIFDGVDIDKYYEVRE